MRPIIELSHDKLNVLKLQKDNITLSHGFYGHVWNIIACQGAVILKVPKRISD